MHAWRRDQVPVAVPLDVEPRRGLFVRDREVRRAGEVEVPTAIAPTAHGLDGLGKRTMFRDELCECLVPIMPRINIENEDGDGRRDRKVQKLVEKPSADGVRVGGRILEAVRGALAVRFLGSLPEWEDGQAKVRESFCCFRHLRRSD